MQCGEVMQIHLHHYAYMLHVSLLVQGVITQYPPVESIVHDRDQNLDRLKSGLNRLIVPAKRF